MPTIRRQKNEQRDGGIKYLSGELKKTRTDDCSQSRGHIKLLQGKSAQMDKVRPRHVPCFHVNFQTHSSSLPRCSKYLSMPSPAAVAAAGPHLAGGPDAKRPNRCCKNLSSLLPASRSAGASDSSGSTFCSLPLMRGKHKRQQRRCSSSVL